jgi:hypothetical protein
MRITGPTLPPGGDGIASRSLAHLEGAHEVDLHDVYHGVIGSRWYGDDAGIDVWWPVALRAWQAAVSRRSRQDGATDAPGDAG